MSRSHQGMVCPLCLTSNAKHFFQAIDTPFGLRDFYQCPTCVLVFVAKQNHLSIEEEKKRYDTHENSPEDQGYRDFLNRLAQPLSQHLSAGDSGLDFGCGPGPAMQTLLSPKGVRVQNYDPHYFPEKKLLTQSYDFVTCTEVIEHLRQPRETFQQLQQLLKVGAYLGVMTQLVPTNKAFEAWWYWKDPTHITFYQEATLAWIATRMQWEIKYAQSGVVIFKRGKSCQQP